MAINLQSAKQWAIDILNEHDIKKKRKQMIRSVAIQKAKARYKKKTGKDMTPSILKDEYSGGYASKDTKEYVKDRDDTEKELREKMKQKKVY